MDATTSVPNSGNVREQFLAWYREEVARNGLKDLKFFPGDVSQATTDLFLAESLAIDQAIKENRFSPLADDI